MQTDQTIPTSMDADYLRTQQYALNQALLQSKLHSIQVLEEMLANEDTKVRQRAAIILCNMPFVSEDGRKTSRKQIPLPTTVLTNEHHQNTLEQAHTAEPEAMVMPIIPAIALEQAHPAQPSGLTEAATRCDTVIEPRPPERRQRLLPPTLRHPANQNLPIRPAPERAQPRPRKQQAQAARCHGTSPKSIHRSGMTPPPRAAGLGSFARLPASLKVVLENMLRFEDGKTVTLDDIRAFSDWA
ncbi:MAG: hypothetical protein HC837_20915, partial [Chloroflexaceae bacterium]|nr:hypothetical protein [Chloroflexaceae bacterium]